MTSLAAGCSEQPLFRANDHLLTRAKGESVKLALVFTPPRFKDRGVENRGADASRHTKSEKMAGQREWQID